MLGQRESPKLIEVIDASPIAKYMKRAHEVFHNVSHN